MGRNAARCDMKRASFTEAGERVTTDTLNALRRRSALWAAVFGVVSFGGLFFNGWVLEQVGWPVDVVFVLTGCGIVYALALRVLRVPCPDYGRHLERKPGGTPTQYYCPKCGVVWDTEFRKVV